MTNIDMVTAIPTFSEQALLNSKDLLNPTSIDKSSQMGYASQSAPKVKLTGHARHTGRETVGRELGRRLQMFKEQQASLDVDDDTDVESSFFIADLGEVYRQFVRWKKSLPRIEPFYAVKCNPDPLVLRLLASLGAGFDCASKDEISNVLALTPSVPHRNIIFANPCKANPQIRFTRQVDVKMMTFDNADELHKCKRH